MAQDNKESQAKAVFEILIRENQAMLMTYLRAVVRQASVVDDLFQETMLTAWRRLDEYDRTRPFGPWLRGIAARLVMAHYRRARSDVMSVEEETLEYLSEQLQHICQRPGDTWDEKIAALRLCVDALSGEHRQVIQLRYFEEAPTARIAEVSETSVESVKKRLQRARAQLLDCLRRKNVITEISA